MERESFLWLANPVIIRFSKQRLTKLWARRPFKQETSNQSLCRLTRNVTNN